MASGDIVERYLNRLQEALPRVPPVSVREIKALHNAKDYEGIVRFIRRAMNLEANLVVGWVNSGGPNDKPNAPAWVLVPSDMPYHGTEAFRKLKLKMYFQKSFLEKSTYDQVGMAVAHELSHIVLDSIRHPLREEEKAVDLTAMLLGFRLLYRSACYKERRSGNTITYRTLGYLTREEVSLANRILAYQDWLAKTEWADLLLAKYKRPLLLAGAVALVALFVVAVPIYRSQRLADELMLEKSQIQKQLPIKLTRSMTLVGVQADATSLTLLHDMDIPKRNVIFSVLEQDARNNVCASDRKEKIKSGASYNFEYRDSARERIGRVEVTSCP